MCRGLEERLFSRPAPRPGLGFRRIPDRAREQHLLWYPPERFQTPSFHPEESEPTATAQPESCSNSDFAGKTKPPPFAIPDGLTCKIRALPRFISASAVPARGC